MSRNNAALAVVGEPTLTVAKNVIVNFAQRHYVVSSLYILGIFCVFFGTGFAVSPSSVAKYDEIMSRIDQRETIDLMRETSSMRASYYNAKGWFSCDATCTTIKKRLDVLESQLAQARKHNDQVASDAKAQVGVFSSYGVQETRDLFWSTFAKGKEFAKNASWWDLMFIGLSSMGRDEGLAEFIVRWLFQVLMNLTLGLIGALVAFVWSVWGVITSYQPSFPMAVVAFILFSVAGISMVATILLSIYGVLACSAHAALRQAQIASIERGGSGIDPRAQIRFGGFGGGGGSHSYARTSYSSSSSSSSDSTLHVGSRVRLFGLSAEQYNGAIGQIVARDGERFSVRLDDGRTLAVRDCNLALL